MNRATRKRVAGGGDQYLKLIRRFPLRPIRTRADYEQAGEILVELITRADSGLTSDESDYADVLTRLVREYDENHSTLLRELRNGKRPAPIELLKHLMAEHQMNTSALGKLVGGSGQASLILNGKRELSKANIRTLADRFHVSPALFF